MIKIRFKNKRLMAGFLASLIIVSVLLFLPAPKASASFLSNVGSFATPSTPQPVTVSGIGFTPKAIVFWGNGETSDNSHSFSQNWTAPQMLMGMTDGTNQATLYNTDDFTAGNPTVDGTHCLRLTASNSQVNTNLYLGTITSMNSGNFVVNFSAIDATHGAGVIVNYMALGGSDLTNVGWKSFTPRTTAGTESYSGVGFQPDALILIGGNTASTSSGGMGFATASTQGAFSSTSSGATLGKYQRTNQSYVEVGGTTKRYEANIVTMDASGFTLNWGTSTAVNTSTLYVLCLKGPSFSVGSFSQKTSLVPDGIQQTTGTGFQPKALLMFSDQAVANTSPVSGLGWMVGGTDGTNRSVIATTDSSAIGDTLSTANVYKTVDGSATTTGVANITSMDANGFTLTYAAPDDGTARQAVYLAIGRASTDHVPAAPTQIAPSSGATGVSAVPTFQLRTTDADNDYLRYKIQLCSDSLCNTVLQTLDQTSIQTGWSGQDQQSSTAYTGNATITSSTIANYTVQSGLSPGVTYYWRAYGIDPAGSNEFSSASSIISFTTSASTGSVQINGGTTINGGTVIQ